jgi:hypothetical protein
MTTVNVQHEYFTCQQVEDLALLKINKKPYTVTHYLLLAV